jgi:hypothetical protein
MKKLSLLLVSFLMGHSLTQLNRDIDKKSIDNCDNHFQSLCPSLRSSVNNTKNNQKNFGIVKIDRDDHPMTNNSLLDVQSDCTESIDRFRDFATNFSETETL